MRKQRGFTLIELVVVVLIVAILAAIAVPAYLKQVRKSRRSEVEAAIQQAALFEERYRADCTSYGAFGATCSGANVSMPSWSSIYSKSYYGTPTVTTTSASYTFTVAATSTNNQNKDSSNGTTCATLYYVYGANTTVDSACSLTSTNVTAAGKTTTCPLDCWAK